MGLPARLRDFCLFGDGNSYQGQCTEAKLPKLGRKFEDYKAAGMRGAIKDDRGIEDLVMEHTYGGIMRDILKQWGAVKHDSVQLRFAGAYQASDSDTPIAVEVVVRGRHQEIDMGEQKPDDDTAFKVQTVCSYYKLVMDGETIIEIDLINNVEKVNGVDLRENIRKATGLA